ncbi:MAG: ABC transporter ATP-binding protein [Spirochaetota bacterium]
MIDVSGMIKQYGYGRNSLVVLKEISLSIERGEIVSIVGPSGAGKSTLLNCIGCLDTFQSGSLVISGKDVSRFNIEELSGFRNRRMGFIFQSNNLLPEFTALENVMMPLLIRRISSGKAKHMAMEIIDRFGLVDRARHKPSELSGGECQRIAVARAIVGTPEIILADEPTGSLDSRNSDNLVSILFELGKEQGATIVLVTHDPSLSRRAHRTITLVDGVIVEADTYVEV